MYEKILDILDYILQKEMNIEKDMENEMTSQELCYMIGQLEMIKDIRNIIYDRTL